MEKYCKSKNPGAVLEAQVSHSGWKRIYSGCNPCNIRQVSVAVIFQTVWKKFEYSQCIEMKVEPHHF